MKTILVTAYAVNPYKGSEDGMGWNFIMQIARYHRVKAVTRINNGPAIRQYMKEHPELLEPFERVEFLYCDWPSWMLGWKKGSYLSMIYYYGWQMTVACWLYWRKEEADIVHNLNFHNDWTPSFLWILGKPMVWGPIGHHPPIPTRFLLPVYGRKAWITDRILCAAKWLFNRMDPFLLLTRQKADKVIGMNSAVLGNKMFKDKALVIPSVACETPAIGRKPHSRFTVLSIGRFVPVKGFDLTIRAFAAFVRDLSPDERNTTRLLLIGDGPQKALLESMMREERLEDVMEIRSWMPRCELQEIYALSDVFLFPSHEGAGMVVAEAMSYGLPVICLDNVGPGEFLSSDSEMRVPYTSYEGTVNALGRRLLELFRCQLLYKKEQEKSLTRFASWLRWDNRSKQLKTLYDNL